MKLSAHSISVTRHTLLAPKKMVWRGSLCIVALLACSGCGDFRDDGPRAMGIHFDTKYSIESSEIHERLAPLVESVKKNVQGNFEVTSLLSGEHMGILINFQGEEPDYDSIVKLITANKDIQAFEGDLRIFFETQTEPEDLTKAIPFRGKFVTTRTYNAKSGEQIF